MRSAESVLGLGLLVFLQVSENYDTWKMHVEALLTKNDNLGYVTGDIVKPTEEEFAKEWELADRKAKADIILTISSGGWGHPMNSPPILTVERKWVIPDTEPIDSVVTKARGADSEDDNLEFGLEPDQNFGFNMAHSGPLPFTIDPKTGVVRTNQSLTGMGGTNLNIYVTVSDGGYTQKTGVWVVIQDSNHPTDDAKAGRPKFEVPLQLRPPGFPVVPPPPIFQQPRQPSPPAVPRPPPTASDESTEESFESLGKRPRPNVPPPPTPAPSNISGDAIPATKTPVMKNTTPPLVRHPTAEHPTTPASGVPHPNMTDIALTVIPITMVTIAFSVVLIAAFLFRRRICLPKKKKKKANKKEDMSPDIDGRPFSTEPCADPPFKGCVQDLHHWLVRDSHGTYLSKKSSNGIGGEEPMVLQHWRGPRAMSNRYTAWDTDPSTPMPQQEAPSVPLFKPKDKWEFPRHQLKVFSILGEGCFGQVWKCEARDIIEGEPGPKIVAVKTLKENAGERERTDIVSELQVMKMLEPHPNVVRLLGCCTEKDPIFVIMEYVSNGKLQSFLRSSRATRSYDNMHGKSDTLTSRQLTSFCYQVARGMEFLSNKGIIHRDLAARNVLVDTDHTCKVADFGFARDVVASHVYERKSEGRLPIRWMAPESLYDNVFSVKSDVWSFGVLIWEIVTLGSTPYPGLSAMEVMKRVKEGERLEKPEHCRRELYNIMYYCWDGEAIKRPDFTELVDLLGQLLLSETDYIELQRFPDHSYYNMVSLSGEKV